MVKKDLTRERNESNKIFFFFFYPYCIKSILNFVRNRYLTPAYNHYKTGPPSRNSESPLIPGGMDASRPPSDVPQGWPSFDTNVIIVFRSFHFLPRLPFNYRSIIIYQFLDCITIVCIQYFKHVHGNGILHRSNNFPCVLF